MTNFAVDGADDACFNFAEDTVAILREGSLKNCNTNGQSWGGAIVNYQVLPRVASSSRTSPSRTPT